MRTIVIIASLWGCSDASVAPLLDATTSTTVTLEAVAAVVEQPHRERICGQQINEEIFVRKSDEFLHLEEGDHVVLMPMSLQSDKLIVTLHGAGGSTAGVDSVLQAFASTGTRSIALMWNRSLDGENRGKARSECLPQVFNDAELNDCLEQVRISKIEDPVWGIEAKLVELLVNLDSTYPSEGWGSFLRFDLDGEGVPNWEKIVVAGYSEGANQTSFMMREVPLSGAILISGGGDLGTIDESEEPADWMFEASLVSPQNSFALYHVDEQYDPNEGWTLSNIPDIWADPASMPLSWGRVHRFEHVADVGGDPNLAHGLTVLPGTLTPAHMFMACGATD